MKNVCENVKDYGGRVFIWIGVFGDSLFVFLDYLWFIFNIWVFSEVLD